MNTKTWRWFRYDEIFEIKKGFYNKKTEENLQGDIPFIGATDSNNGVTSMHDLETIEKSSKTGDENNAPLKEKLFEPNCITVSNNGSVGYAFYQTKKFTCSHDVNPLYLKDYTLNAYIAMFLCGIILSATAENNGLCKWINLESEFEAGTITNEKVHCTTFYQPTPFCATSDVNVISLKQGQFNKYVGLFLATIIEFSESYKWTYGRQCRKNDTEKIRIKLPVKSPGQPNWEWMEDYIKSLPYSKCL